MANKSTPSHPVAITRRMIESGLTVLDVITTDETKEHTDDELVASVFFAMWQEYWKEVEEVRRGKRPSAVIAQPPKPKLILPSGFN